MQIIQRGAQALLGVAIRRTQGYGNILCAPLARPLRNILLQPRKAILNKRPQRLIILFAGLCHHGSKNGFRFPQHIVHLAGSGCLLPVPGQRMQAAACRVLVPQQHIPHSRGKLLRKKGFRHRLEFRNPFQIIRPTVHSVGQGERVGHGTVLAVPSVKSLIKVPYRAHLHFCAALRQNKIGGRSQPCIRIFCQLVNPIIRKHRLRVQQLIPVLPCLRVHAIIGQRSVKIRKQSSNIADHIDGCMFGIL